MSISAQVVFSQSSDEFTEMMNDLKLAEQDKRYVIREVKIDVYGRPVTANAKLQVEFSVEVLPVRS